MRRHIALDSRTFPTGNQDTTIKFSTVTDFSQNYKNHSSLTWGKILKTWVGLFTQITTKILLRLDISLERLSPTELSPEVPSIMTFINYTDENLFSAAGSHKYTEF